jgi:hypothetical protein
MDRLKRLAVAAAVAAVVSVVAAGPAVAAKGGNSDNAHACQQGGHQNRFEAETGNPFKNAGDCTSHGARSGITTFLIIDPSSYPCTDSTSGATCWGAISAAGLFKNIGWAVFPSGGTEPARFGTADAGGAVGPDPPVPLNLPCQQGFPDVFAISSTSLGAPIVTQAVGSSCG